MVKINILLFLFLITLSFCHQKKKKIKYKYEVVGWIKKNKSIKKAIWYTDTICFISNELNFFRKDTFCIIRDTGYYFNSDGSMQKIYPPYTIKTIN